MPSVILALDQGTTSSRAIAFDRHSNVVAMAQRPLPQHYPQPGWVEHCPEDIWQTQLATAQEVVSRVGVDEVAAIGITNQRETTILWDRKTGEPIHRAIVWQDRRTAEACDRLISEGWAERIAKKTGLVIDAYFSATKIAWLLDHVPGAREQDLAFGTVETYLLWKLTGGRIHATDASNASRTMLFDIERFGWDDDLLSLFRISRSILPTVVPSSGVLAETDPHLFGRAIPIAGLAGDQQAATFGQCCFEPGMVKSTYGTGCFLLMNVGDQPKPSQNRLLSTVLWEKSGEWKYGLEGSVFVAGAAVQWLRDELGLVSSAEETAEIASSVEDTAGVYLVPAFTGLGAPYWDPHARGALVGLTRGAGRAHIVRAALESIAFQCRDVLEAMQADCGVKLQELRVDGGAAGNDFLLQFQADILGIPVVRPQVIETTALGAAYLAGLATGFWAEEELSRSWKVDKVFEPKISNTRRAELVDGWQKAVRRTLS